MSITQNVSFSLLTHSSGQTFRILNIYRVAEGLVVVSKRSDSESGWGAGMGRPTATASIEVDSELPVAKHYVIGLKDKRKMFLPEWPYIAITSQAKIPANEKATCLYANPLTEEKEEEKRITAEKEESERLAEFMAEMKKEKTNTSRFFSRTDNEDATPQKTTKKWGGCSIS